MSDYEHDALSKLYSSLRLRCRKCQTLMMKGWQERNDNVKIDRNPPKRKTRLLFDEDGFSSSKLSVTVTGFSHIDDI